MITGETVKLNKKTQERINTFKTGDYKKDIKKIIKFLKEQTKLYENKN